MKSVNQLVAEIKENGQDFEWYPTTSEIVSAIRRRKRYERQFTDYRVIKCFVLCLSEKGKTTAKVGYFDCNQKCFLDEPEGMVYAWKEITLPALPKEIKEK